MPAGNPSSILQASAQTGDLRQKPWPEPKPGPAGLGFGPWLGFHILEAQAKKSPAKPEALGQSPAKHITNCISRYVNLTLCFLILYQLCTPATIVHCEAMYLCEGFLGAAVASATAFLFFARVRAVYENSKLVTITFGVFWLALTGASFVPSFSAKPVRVGTAGCTINNVNPGLASASLWIMAAYDTSTFLAITWRIVVLSVPMRRGLLRPSLWSVVRGDVPGLSQIGRDLLKGGQLFYFATIGVTLFGACIVFMPIPALFRLILVEPTFAISSTMACRVFRTIILRPRSRATRPQHPHGGTESSNDEDEGGKEDVQCVLTTVMPYDQEQEQGATYWERALELHVQADLEGHANTSGRQSLGVH
ncbi:hypothetical protein FIBSPDRAFT_1055026 [Athelia psychrophila]|uniref:Uncharacterized protein n=1 Tax=Athelia psychrophila TaxID=1759441 RepID=A0A167UFF4_9AGAM|nr:hypothetical protein FIBSPDRAFT_1055026 [Fibularhizoctonia sp. CBS 109695]